MKALEGTPMLALWLNVMGAHISPRAVLGAYSQVIDPDMITIDAHSTVMCSFQVHTFEDRMLKINHLHVHEGATVMEAAVAMYGVDVGTNAHVSANSCIIKNEHLAPGKSYSGVPVNHMDEVLAHSYEKDLEAPPLAFPPASVRCCVVLSRCPPLPPLGRTQLFVAAPHQACAPATQCKAADEGEGDGDRCRYIEANTMYYCGCYRQLNPKFPNLLSAVWPRCRGADARRPGGCVGGEGVCRIVCMIGGAGGLDGFCGGQGAWL